MNTIIKRESESEVNRKLARQADLEREMKSHKGLGFLPRPRKESK